MHSFSKEYRLFIYLEKKKSGERKPRGILHHHSVRDGDFLLTLSQTGYGLKRPLKPAFVDMPQD